MTHVSRFAPLLFTAGEHPMLWKEPMLMDSIIELLIFIIVPLNFYRSSSLGQAKLIPTALSFLRLSLRLAAHLRDPSPLPFLVLGIWFGSFLMVGN